MTCLIRFLFHFPCPTCGVTRALISLIQGHFDKYCYYNIMALPLLCATILMIIGSKQNITIYKIISCLILIINIPYYLYRLKLGTIP